MTGINAYSVFLSRDGGILDVVSPEGEIVSSVAVPAGRVRASKYLDLVPPGHKLEVAEGLEVFHPAARLGSRRGGLPYPYKGGVIEVGANPNFVPTNAASLEGRLRLQMRKLAQVGQSIERRFKALEKVERIPSPVPAPVEVIEPAEPAPAPKDQEAQVE